MIRIAHMSDTHDKPSIVKAVRDVECNVIVLTGDIIGNKGRVPFIGGGWDTGMSNRINPVAERKYQESWFRKVAKTWAPAFKGRPVIYVPGNHDFIDIERWIRHYGHQDIFTISEKQPSVTVCGKVFAGFREVPWIAGEWRGETHEFQPLIERTMACNPDILVTHAPPGGILDGPNGYGVSAWTAPLFYGEHRVTHHFFGHAHEDGGKVVTEGGITFSNAACHMNIIEVP